MKNIVLLIIGFLFGVFLISKCANDHKVTAESAKSIIDYRDSAVYYKSKYGHEVAHNSALKMSLRDAEYLIDSIKPFLADLGVKRPDAIIRVKTITRIDTIVVKLHDSIPCDKEFVIHDSAYAEGRYDIGFTITPKQLRFDHITIPNTQSIVLGEKKNGFMRRPSYEALVVNSNPYVRVTNIGAISIKPKVKFYDRLWFKAAVFGAGFFLGHEVSL